MKTRRARKPGLFRRLGGLYHRMEKQYDELARRVEFSCRGCEDNCCVSFFQHHTHIEWAYLWQGLQALPQEQRERYLERARLNVELCREALARGELPRVMCPLNDDGLCGVYAHRLMICRLHGVANTLTMPGRLPARWPGCDRFQAIVRGLDPGRVPVLDRTPLYRELAELEMEHLSGLDRPLPRVDMTLAEMLVAGPPPSLTSRG